MGLGECKMSSAFVVFTKPAPLSQWVRGSVWSAGYHDPFVMFQFVNLFRYADSSSFGFFNGQIKAASSCRQTLSSSYGGFMAIVLVNSILAHWDICIMVWNRTHTRELYLFRPIITLSELLKWFMSGQTARCVCDFAWAEFRWVVFIGYSIPCLVLFLWCHILLY